MSKTKDLQAAILANPSKPNFEFAEEFHTTYNFIAKTRSNLRKKSRLQALRSESSAYAKHQSLIEECDAKGIPVENVTNYWYKGEHFSIHANAKDQISWDDIRAELVKDMQRYAPKYPVIKRPAKKEPLLFVLDAADPHFGKYSAAEETGDSYNLQKACDRFSSGVKSLISKIQNEQIEKIVFISGNDRNHVDNAANTTTSGTRQDISGMWFEHFRASKKAEIEAIEILSTVADVHYVHCGSNHDYVTGYLLADTVASWFRKNKNVTFDISPSHRKYLHYGLNLIGCTHGDGAKEEDLPSLMMTEARQAWAKSQYAYWYVHHIHHKDKKARLGSQKIQLEKDKIGVSVLHTGLNIDPSEHSHVEYLRSISGTDSWHHRNGYQHSFKAMEGFLHHPIAGQVSRLMHLF